jgi:adenylate cyclase
MATQEAREQIEATLRHSREETELQIARYRVGVFALGLVVNVGMSLPRKDIPLSPTVILGVATVYAFIVWRFIRARGALPAVTYAVVVLDMAIMGATFLVTTALNGIDERYAGYPMLILPAVLFTLMLLNSLRYSRSAAVVGAVSALIIFPLVELPVVGFHPAEIVVEVLLGAAGYITYRSAQRARESLDRFARLQLLRRYLSPAAVERVLRANPDEALALGGELLTVTLLAADLRDFTAMSEKLSARDVVEQLNEYHGAMLEQIDRHGGLLDKFIGDGTLAVFGLRTAMPAAQADAGASAAVACARSMREALDALNARRGQRGQPPLRMGVGIHTGQVIAGNIGAPGRRLEFTVIGDSVNTVARLEGLTKEAGVPVLITSATADRLPNRDGLREMPAMHAKGKEQALSVLAFA